MPCRSSRPRARYLRTAARGDERHDGPAERTGSGGHATMSQHTGGLLCPACRVDLVMSERHGVEIDYCPKCRGVWLDRGELDKILERGAAELGGRAGSQT